jgi:acetyl-CoA carboxylase carboxyl transferase subunit beta
MSIRTWMELKREKEIEHARFLRDGPLPITPENSLFARKQLWVRCELCGVILYISHLPQYHHTCKECGENVAMTPEERVASLIDPGSWVPMDELYSAGDPLNFNDKKSYRLRLAESQERTGTQDAIQTGSGLLDGVPVALGVMAFEFMGGSMGSVVGEKVTRLIEYATVRGLMLIMVCASGGARMQEGILSLMQMAKISGALYAHQCSSHLNYISVLTSPTTGGVTASFAMLGDVIIAEPKAVIGFAGRRVIEQTLRETLPDDFQTAEYLMDHGLVDLIIHRKYLRGALAYMLNFNACGYYRRPGTISAAIAGETDRRKAFASKTVTAKPKPTGGGVVRMRYDSPESEAAARAQAETEYALAYAETAELASAAILKVKTMAAARQAADRKRAYAERTGVSPAGPGGPPDSGSSPGAPVDPGASDVGHAPPPPPTDGGQDSPR